MSKAGQVSVDEWARILSKMGGDVEVQGDAGPPPDDPPPSPLPYLDMPQAVTPDPGALPAAWDGETFAVRMEVAKAWLGVASRYIEKEKRLYPDAARGHDATLRVIAREVKRVKGHTHVRLPRTDEVVGLITEIYDMTDSDTSYSMIIAIG